MTRAETCLNAAMAAALQAQDAGCAVRIIEGADPRDVQNVRISAVLSMEEGSGQAALDRFSEEPLTCGEVLVATATLLADLLRKAPPGKVEIVAAMLFKMAAALVRAGNVTDAARDDTRPEARDGVIDLSGLFPG